MARILILETSPSGASPYYSGAYTEFTNATAGGKLYAGSGIYEGFVVGMATNPTKLSNELSTVDLASITFGSGIDIGTVDVRGTGDNYFNGITKAASSLNADTTYHHALYVQLTGSAGVGGGIKTGIVGSGAASASFADGNYSGTFNTDETVYNFNTVYNSGTEIGSGVHNERNLNLGLSLVDRDNEAVIDTQGLLDNPFISGIHVDILNSAGATVYSGFKSGLRDTNVVFSEADNQQIFGEYTKNFAIQTRVVSQNGFIATGQFYLYGNELNIAAINVTDGTGQFKDENPINFKAPNTGIANALPLTNRQRISNDFISGQIQFQLKFDPTRTLPDSVDVYGTSGAASSMVLDSTYLIKTVDLPNAMFTNVVLTPDDNITANTDYYFTLVPKAYIGTGEAWSIGPYRIKANAIATDPIIYSNVENQSVQPGFTIGTQVPPENGNTFEVFGNDTDDSYVSVVGIGTTAGNVGIGSSEPSFPLDASPIASANIAAANSQIYSTGSAIFGGANHIISGDFDVIAGGSKAHISGGKFNFIGGGSGVNVDHSTYSSSVGGYNNDVFSGSYSVIGGGISNLISGKASESHSDNSAILGGQQNKVISAPYSFIGGGNSNLITGTSAIYSALIGGNSNKITDSQYGVILGGDNNEINYANTALSAGNYSVVQSGHHGAFVLSDSRTAEYQSTGGNTLNLRFQSGVFVDTDSGIYINGNPVVTGSSDTDTDTLQTVTDRGNTTTTSMAVHGQYLSGVSGVFDTVDITGADTLTVSGNVGIGTNAPASTAGSDRFLEVYGPVDAGLVISSNNGEWDIKNVNPSANLNFLAAGSHRVTFATAGNVGIGSQAPAYKLDVAGDIQAKDSVVLAGVNSTRGYSFHDLGTNWGFKGLSSPGRLGVLVQGIESMTFESNGRVGIGISDPTPHKFGVAGSISGSGDFYGTGVGSRITNNGTPYLLSGDAAAALTLQDVTDNGNTTTNAVFINNTGYGADYAPLNVSGGQGGGTAPLAFFRGTGTTAYIQLQNSTTSYGSASQHGLTLGNNGNDAYVMQREAAPLYLGTSGEARMTVKEDGRVGIGVLTPDSILEVIGTGNTNATYAFRVRDSDDNQLFSVRDDGVVQVSDNYFFVDSSQGAYIQQKLYARGGITDDQGNLQLGGSGNVDALYINSGGNVGIGTDIPYAYDTTTTRFHVKNAGSAGSVSELARFEGASDADGAGALVRIGTSNDRGIYLEGGRVGSVPYAALGTTEYDGAKTEGIRISSAGYVGIKNANPQYELDVSGEVAGTGVGSRITLGGVPYLLSGDAAAALTLQDVCDNGNTTTTTIESTKEVGSAFSATSGTDRYFVVDASGRIGLNAGFSPTHSIEIDNWGNKRPANIWLNSSTLHDASIEFSHNGAYGFIMGSDETDRKFKISSGNALGTNDRLVIDTAGNVGINTTSPEEKLHVGGDIRVGTGGAADYNRVEFTRYGGAVVGGIGWHSDSIFYVAGHPSFGPTAGNDVRVYGFGGDLHLGDNANGDVLTIDYTNGDVGIGTAAPSGTLHILGGYDANNPNTLVIAGRENASTVYGGIQFERAGGTTFFGIGNDSRADRDELYLGGGFGGVKAATAFRVFTEGPYGSTVGEERLTIVSGGNVGIGTNDPSTQLDVVGTGAFDRIDILDSTYSSNPRLTVGRNANEQIQFYVDDMNNKITALQDTDGDGDHRFILDREFDGTGVSSFHIANSGNYQLTIDKDNKIGMGYNSPSDFDSEANRLVIGDGAGSEGMTVYAGTSSSASIFFADGTAGSETYRGIVQYRHSDDRLDFWAGAGRRMSVDGNGVGIGTYTITSKLDVSGAYSDSVAKFKDGSDGVEITTRGSSRQQIDFLGTNTSAINAKGSLWINYDTNNDGSNDVITFARNAADVAGTVDMVIAEGDVGIGTNDPAYKLDVQDAAAEVAQIKRTNAGNCEFLINPVGGDAKVVFQNSGTDIWSIGKDNSDSSFRISEGGALETNPRFTVDNGGNVGVGTTNPTDLFTVYADGGGSTTDLVNVGGTGNGRMLVRHIDGKDSVSAATGPLFLNYGISENVLVAYGGGNVGIGSTTNPQALLHVHKANTTGPTIELSNSEYRAYINSWGSTASAGRRDRFEINATSSDFAVASSGIYFQIGGAGDSYEKMRIDSNGNVGIGTDSPSNALDVVGHFSATSKSFLIDHPTQENKKLQYASLEGPENGVYVRGTTNSKIIELPEYWSELVHEDSITVVLTPIGKKQNLYIKSKDPQNVMVGGVEGSYDYVIYGERKDIDKLEVEPLKV